jgi:hypothetical protein
VAFHIGFVFFLYHPAIVIIFLLNKQLFSSLKIRRYMMRWAKCWARKSPAYIKNLGNIRVENSPILAGKKSAEILDTVFAVVRPIFALLCCLLWLSTLVLFFSSIIQQSLSFSSDAQFKSACVSAGFYTPADLLLFLFSPKDYYTDPRFAHDLYIKFIDPI